MILRWGPQYVTGFTAAGLSVVWVGLTQVEQVPIFQSLSIVMGILSMGNQAALLTLRSRVTPKGQNMR